MTLYLTTADAMVMSSLYSYRQGLENLVALADGNGAAAFLSCNNVHGEFNVNITFNGNGQIVGIDLIGDDVCVNILANLQLQSIAQQNISVGAQLYRRNGLVAFKVAEHVVGDLNTLGIVNHLGQMGLICRAEHAVGAAAALVLVLDAGGLGNSCTLGSISNVGEILQAGSDHPLTGD